MLISGKAGTRLLALCVLFFFATGVRASTFVVPTDDDLIVGARAIVRAKVLSMNCQLDESSGRIFTYVRLRVREVFKGHITDGEIVIKEEGGQVGARGSMVFGTPQFTAGDNVVLYLDTWPDGSLRVYQMFLGKFLIVQDPRTGERLVVRDAGDKNSAVLQNETLREGVATSLEPFEAYRKMVRERLRINRERSQKFDETYYKNSPMLAVPAEYKRVSGNELDAQFTFLASPPPRWFEPDSGQPVVFFVNPDGAPNPQIMDDTSAAMNAWSSVPGSSIRIMNGGAAAVCYPRDSNSIVFSNCEGQFSPTPGCAGAIALGGVSWDSSQTRIINGTTFVRAMMGHISFNPYSSCSFGDHCSVQEIATHEMGHALGLGHSRISDATMFGVAHFDGRCASIRQDDIDAITFVYPASGGGSGPLTVVTASPVGIGTAGSLFSRQLLASGGVAPYSWSLGSGSLPEGLSLSPSGIISGTPATTGTSDFTVKVADALGAAAQKSLSITVVAPPSGYDSQFISQDVPATLNPKQSFFATIRWVNTSTKPWGSAGFAIVSQNPANNVSWGGDMVPWIHAPIAPGEQMDLVFQTAAPGRPGIYNFQWQLYQQEVGFFGQMSTNVSITVGDPGAPPDSPSIGGLSSLTAQKGTFFTYILPATGGTPPYTWQVATGALPAGIGLNPNTGTLTGTPTDSGTSSVTVQMTDSKSQMALKGLTITVTGPPFDIATSALPTTTKGVSFSQQLNATGGKPSYTWAVTAGALPGGLGLTSATGIISGTPNAIGSFGFTATATDAESHTASKAFTITVVAPPLSAASVPALDGLKGSSFSYQLAATGGTPSYTWSITAGALPSGLSLSSTVGLISGVPTVAGSFTLVVTVRDQASVSATTSVQIKLLDPETIPAITRAKYKGGKKLIVTGDRINAAAVLLVDGNQVSAAVSEGSFVMKPIALAPGRHELKIVNPGGVSSQSFILNVD
jgi:Putative Ig domain/Matrixin